MDATPAGQETQAALCWHGTPSDWERLYTAVLLHCATPVKDAEGAPLEPCLACPVCLQLFDQKALNRMALVGKYRSSFVEGDDRGGCLLGDDAPQAKGECAACRLRRRWAEAVIWRERDLAAAGERTRANA